MIVVDYCMTGRETRPRDIGFEWGRISKPIRSPLMLVGSTWQIIYEKIVQHGRNYMSEKLIGGLTALFALPRDQPCSIYFSILRISRVFDRIGNPLKKNKIVAIEENILNSFHLSMRIFFTSTNILYSLYSLLHIFTILFMFNSESPSLQFTITRIKWQ